MAFRDPYHLDASDHGFSADDEHVAIHFGGLALMTAFENHLGLFVNALDDHFNDLTFASLVFGSGDLLLQFHELSLAAVLGPLGDRIAERECGCAFFGRVGEDSHVIELRFLDEGPQFLKSGFGFAGKTHDEIGSDGDAGADGSELRKQFRKARAAATPCHFFQHFLIRVLQGHVQVLGAIFGFRDGVHDAFGKAIGIGVVDAEPAQAFDFAQGADEFFERIGIAKIPAVIRGVLGHQADFENALGHEIFRLGDDAFDAATALAAPQFRNDTEGAGMVAAFADLKIGRGFGRGEQPRAVLVIEIVGVLLGLENLVSSADDLGDLLDIAGTQAGVYFGNIGEQFIAVAFHQAARHDELFAGPGFLHFRSFENGVNTFLLCGINESAGVHHQDIGLVHLVGDHIALEPQMSQHDLAIHKVLGTSQGHESHGGGQGVHAGLRPNHSG